MRFLLLLLSVAFALAAQAANPLPIAKLNRSKPVDFETEILPILKQSCLACHNQTKAKAELILETPQTILKGGDSGPAVVPGKPDESLLFQVSSHREKPFMPPAENKANAPDLTADQLALLRLWIEQGATGEMRGRQIVAWRPVPARVRPVLAVALTDDAQFAACSRGNELYLYHLPSGRALGPLVDPELRKSAAANSPAHLDLIESLDFSPDGEWLASGSYREVKLWRRQPSRRGNSTAPGGLAPALQAAKRFSLSPDGNRVAVLTADNKIAVWSVVPGKVESERSVDCAPERVAWFADGSKLLTFSGTNLQVWSSHLSTNQTITTSQPILLAAASSNRVFTVSSSNAVQSWSIETGAASPVTNLPTLAITALAISPDLRTLALGSRESGAILVNLADGRKRDLNSDYPTAYKIAQLQRALTRAGNYLAYRKGMLENAEKERTSQIDRVRTAGEAVSTARKVLAEQESHIKADRAEETAVQKELSTIQSRLKEAQTSLDKAQIELAQARRAAKGVTPEALEARLDELTARAASAALASNTLALLKPEAEKSEKAVQEKLKATQKKITDAEALLKRHQITNAAAENELQFAISAAQGAADNLTLAQTHFQSAESDRKQLDAQLESVRSTRNKTLRPIRMLAFNKDGSLLGGVDEARPDQDPSGKAALWNTETGATLANFSPTSTAFGLGFSSDGRLLTCSADTAEAWELTPAWKLERTISTANGQPAFADRVNAVRFSPDGQFLATGSGEPSRGGEIKIWRTRDGQLQQELKNVHSDSVLSLAYSPDGHYLASGAADRLAKITELASGKVIRTLEGHTHHVLSLAWKADGHTLITGAADNLVKVWDAFSGEKKKGPEAFGKEVTGVTYLAASDELLASSGDGTLRIYKDNGDKVRSFEGAMDFIQASTAAPDGSLVLAGAQDGMLRLWRASGGKPIAEFGQ